MSRQLAQNPAVAQTGKSLIRISGAHLRRHRRKLALSQQEFGEKIGLSESGVRAIESGRTRSVYASTFRAIAETIGMSIDEARSQLSGWDQNLEPYSELKLFEVPLFELSVAAGNWTDVEGAGEICDPRQMEQGLFRVRLRGDSMRPTYNDGDVVEFRCLRADHDGIIVGRDYYVQRNDGMATFKRIESLDDDSIVLRALNKRKYPDPLIVPRQEAVRLALAVAKVQLLGE
jgi:transcriptional regulator with XRE-family HTH domain